MPLDNISAEKQIKAANEQAQTLAGRWPTLTAEGRRSAAQSLYDGPLLRASESAFKAEGGGPRSQDPAYLAGYDAGLEDRADGDNPFCAWRQHDEFCRWLAGLDDGHADFVEDDA